MSNPGANRKLSKIIEHGKITEQLNRIEEKLDKIEQRLDDVDDMLIRIELRLYKLLPKIE